jgi:site-specific DNA-methyltransferase (adenine-specific)
MLFQLPVESIPLTVTSPPYDAIRDYGSDWNQKIFEKIAKGLWYVTTGGGVVAWNVQDQIIDGSESCTSACQLLFFRSLGFTLVETLIIMKRGRRFPPAGPRYDLPPEYVFVLSKGTPAYFRPICDRKNITAGGKITITYRKADGSRGKPHDLKKPIPKCGPRRLLWVYNGKYSKDRYAFEHPAVMVEGLARDLILSWSAPGSLVLDPFCGAATTCKMALLHDRSYLGIELNRGSFAIAERRMQDAHALYNQKLDRIFQCI